MYNGVINVYKEAGFTSHDVVAKLRGILKMKKIGHTGTLDPDAVGVLPVCLGHGTKVSDMLTDETKEYVAVLKLGIETDTQDMSGTVLKDMSHLVPELKKEDILSTIMSFKGESSQIPPMYSAIKVNGQKLYDLARKGIEVERKPRAINIYDIEIIENSDSFLKKAGFEPIDPDDKSVYVMRVVCSKGTYIRTLCHDIGSKLGCGGCMQHLIRSRVSCFDLDNAYKLADIEKMEQEGTTANIITAVDKLFDKYPALHVKEEAMKALMNGNQLKPDSFLENLREVGDEEVYRIYSYVNEFTGIYSYDGKFKLLTPVKMFF